MNTKRFPRFLSCVLVAVLVFLLTPGRAYAVSQEEIDELRRERLAIAMEHDEKQAVVDELEAQKADILARKEAMDERNELTRQEIDTLLREIDVYDEMIVQEAIKVEQAKAREDIQLERYRTHIRAMEENGEMSYLALILHIRSFSELLTALDDAGDIMKSDNELYHDYIDARENTELAKAQYEEKKVELEAEQQELRAQQAALEAEIAEAVSLISNLENDIETKNEELHQLLLAEIAAADRIDQLVAQQERERREAEERRRQEEQQRAQQESAGGGGGSSGSSGGSVTGTGSFGWPCPGCNYITSRAGNRWHPIFNEWRYHSGLDIGASQGSTVVASDGGTVIMASTNGGYGKCVMIDHGNGYYTLYGHLSGYAVSNGQTVSKGQAVGYVGSTGWATGPHLHFEIRKGSTCLDPEVAGGFTGLTYAPDAGQ